MISQKTHSLRTIFFLLSLAAAPSNAMGMTAPHSPQKRSPLKEKNVSRDSLDILCRIALGPDLKASPVKRVLDLDAGAPPATISTEKSASIPTAQPQSKPLLKKNNVIAILPENSTALAKKKIKFVLSEKPIQTHQYEPMVRLSKLHYTPFLPHKTYTCKWQSCTKKFKEADFFNHLCKHICTIGTERKQNLKNDIEMNTLFSDNFYGTESVYPWVECPMCTNRLNPNRTKQHFSSTLSLQQFLPLDLPVHNFATNNIQDLIDHIFQDHYFNLALNNDDLKRITRLTPQINWHCIATHCQGSSLDNSLSYNTPCPRDARKVFTVFWELYWHLRGIVFYYNHNLRKISQELEQELYTCPFCSTHDLTDESLSHSQIMDHILATHYNFPDTCPLCLGKENEENADAFTPLHIQRFHNTYIQTLPENKTVTLFACPTCTALMPLNNTPAIFVHYINCCLEKKCEDADRIISISFQFGSIQKQKNPLSKQYIITSGKVSRLQENYEQNPEPLIPILNHAWHS